MELDLGAWVVHRHVIDACLDELETPPRPETTDPYADSMALADLLLQSLGRGPSPAL